MDPAEKIERAKLLLTEARDELTSVPAMIVLPPDSGDFIIGNESGFVRLAICAIEAAQGEQQSFAKEAWVSDDDLDWSVKGLKPDALAHLHLPVPPSRWQTIRNSVVGWAFLLCIVSCFVVGLGTIVHWIMPFK
jgi:hypothetical protein